MNPIAPHRVQKLYYATADFILPGRQPVTLAPITTVIDDRRIIWKPKLRRSARMRASSRCGRLFEEYARKRGRREIFHLVAVIKRGNLGQRLTCSPE